MQNCSKEFVALTLRWLDSKSGFDGIDLRLMLSHWLRLRLLKTTNFLLVVHHATDGNDDKAGNQSHNGANVDNFCKRYN